MLGKLIKYEWKSMCKMGCLLLLGILVITLLGVLGFSLPFSGIVNTAETLNNSVSDSEVIKSALLTMLSVCSMLVYMFALVGLSYGMLIYIGVHFYKTMYSDEGYLTHTLPVTPHQLIVSKVLVAGIWYTILMAVMMISVFVLIISTMFFMEGMLGEFLDATFISGEVWSEVFKEMGLEGLHMLLSMLLYFLIMPFSATMMLLGALTIGQLASKFRVLMGILVYFGICMANSVLTYIISFITSFSMSVVDEFADTSHAMAATYDGQVLSMVIMLVAFYFITKSIITSKLNLE